MYLVLPENKPFNLLSFRRNRVNIVKSVKRFERSNGLDTALYKTIPFLIKIPNTFRKLFGSSDSRSGDAETRGAEARRFLVNSIQRRRVSLSFTRFIVRLIII